MQITKGKLFVHRLEVLEILWNLCESCHLEKSATGCHQLKRITNRMSEAPASNLASCCREFRDHESDRNCETSAGPEAAPWLAELPTDDDQWEGSDKEPQSEAKPGGFCAGSCIIKFAAISLGGFHNSTHVKRQTAFGDMLFYCFTFFTKALLGKPIEILRATDFECWIPESASKAPNAKLQINSLLCSQTIS